MKTINTVIKVSISVLWIFWSGLALFRPDLYAEAIQYKSGAIPRFIVLTLFFVYIREGHKRYSEYKKLHTHTPTQWELFGAALTDLIRFIVEHDWLPTKEAREWFWWTGEQYTECGKFLDRLLLTENDRSNNNRRTLIIGDEYREEVLTDALTHDYYPSSSVSYA